MDKKNAERIAAIEKEIEATKLALKDVHGTETEVYARIVGYYRAVKHWNNGKKDEFALRRVFTLEDSNLESQKNAVSEAKTQEVLKTPAKTAKKTSYTSDLESVSYELYTRKTCPNCPPVKAFMSGLEMPGRNIDVDTKEGLSEAAKKGIFASPTVIFYNAEGTETERCHNVEELEAVFQKVAVSA